MSLVVLSALNSSSVAMVFFRYFHKQLPIVKINKSFAKMTSVLEEPHNYNY